MLQFNFSRLKDKKTDKFGFAVDIFMLLLIVVNLGFIIFDWHFGFAFFQRFLQHLSPAFYIHYRDVVHPNFLLYDLFFVAIYVTELMVSWLIAIKRKTFERWYFYPLVYWYDVLGCIPVGTFRWLRILRIFSIMIRLHKLGVVDLTESYLFKKANRLYKIILEEISDRVIIRILNGVESEIKDDSPVSSRMITEILEPHKDTIARWLSHRVKQIAENNYNLYMDDLQNYIETAIGEAIRQNKEIRKIRAIPFLGKQITGDLEHSVGNIVYQSVNGLIKGLTTEKSQKLIEDAIQGAFNSMLTREPDSELTHMIKDISIQSLELVKQQVKVKKWMLNGNQTVPSHKQ